jgi:lipoprotein-anchoring transpeptidase ErfK/SrfK
VNKNFSEEKLGKVLDAFPELQDDKMEAPADAYMDFKDAKFVIVEEKQGTKIAAGDKVRQAVRDAVKSGKKELDLEKEIPDLYERPKKLSDDKKLNEEVKQLNELVSASITYDLPGDEKKILDGNTLKDWLVKDDDGNYKMDEAAWTKKLTDYVAELAASVDTYDRDVDFPATGIGTVKVHNMTYGYLINQAGEIDQLRKDIKSGTPVERKLVYSNWQTSDANNGFGDNYVEIDCTRQHLWLYENGKVALETDIVSGAMDGERTTPTGVYMFVTKESPSLLVGRDANNKVMYRQPVSYFMPFIGMGIGIHDATWQSAFGGTRYRDGYGSHGCINIPLDKAEKMYGMINFEMPVVVYYS